MTHKTSSRGLSIRALSLGIAAALAAPQLPAQSLPTGFTDATNVGAPTSDGTTMTVNVTGPRAYAEWGTFDVPVGTTFNVTSSVGNSYIFVNRVVGGTASAIDGAVNAGGNFWLINPAGIAVSGSGAFNVGGLLLSTATTLNGEDETANGAAFLAGTTNTFSFGGAASAVILQPGARVVADIGTIAMISNDILNVGGVLDAGTGEIALVGGRDVTVGFDADLNAFTTLTINGGSGPSTTGNSGYSVVVGDAAKFTGSRTVIAAAGATDGQGSILLTNNGGANSLEFVDGDVVLYAAPTGGGNVISGGAVAPIGTFDANAARVRLSGLIAAPDNLSIFASGGVGHGSNDLNVSAAGTMTISGPVFGQDVALNAGGLVTLTSAEARDDLVIRSNGITATGQLSSGVTVDGLATVDVAGAGDVLNGPTLSGNDMSLYGEAGDVNLAVAPLVGDGYRVRGADFFGAALSPTWVGGGFENTFVITDTAGGFTASNLTSPGRLWIEVRNGGDLNVSGPLASTRGDVQLITTGGGNINLAGDVTSGSRSGSANEYLVLKSSGAINQTGGIINTTLSSSGQLYATAISGISLLQNNLFATAAFQNAGAGGIQVRNAGSGAAGVPFQLTNVNVDGFSPAIAGATTGSGDILIDAASGMLVNGVPVTTGAGNIVVNGATTVAGATTFTATGGTATFGGTIDGNAAGQGDLVVSATGAIFNGNVGATSAVSSLTVNGATTLNAGTMRASNAIDLDGLTIDAGAPATVTVESTGGALTTGAVTANHTGTFVGRGATISLGSFASANSSLDLSTTAGALTVGAVDAGRAVSLASIGGNITSTGAVQAAGNIAINSAGALFASEVRSTGGTVSIAAVGNVGGLASGSRMNVSGAGQVALQTDGTALLGTVSSTGGDVLVAANGLDANVTNANGALSLNGGNRGITLGSGSARSTSLNASGAVNVAGPLTTGLLTGTAGGGATLGGANQIEQLGNFTTTNLVLNNARALDITGTVDTGSGDATIAVTGGNLGITSTGQVRGRDLALSTDANFVNASGSDAAVASGHWVIYSTAPGGNMFDNLDSGNTALWNATIGTLAPGSVSGNRYVFAFQPTLTFTTADISKVYGTDLTSNPGLAYTITGFQPGVAGAFLADTEASVFSGAPRLTSQGFAPRASVNGGPYAITIDQGSLASNTGYAFDFSNAGSVTVTPLAISGTGVPDDKTYDGTTSTTGNIVLNGVLAGDEVGATGQFAFGTPNAGTGLTVTLTGVGLTGADAGNYTVTVTGVELADILQRSLTVTANPLTKPEGDPDPALTWTITGGSLVAGDSLSGSLSRMPGEAPGVYDILQGSLSASSNYRLTFVGSTLTITEVAITPEPVPTVAWSDDPSDLLDTLESPLQGDAAGDLQVVDERMVCESGETGDRCPQAQPN